MVRIRLKRVGGKKHPFYRIVVADQRAARDGAFIEQIGTYDPFPDPPEIKIDEEKYKKWVGNGAQPSESVVSLMQSAGVLPKVNTAAPVEEKAAPKKAAPKKAAAKTEPKAAPKAAAKAEPKEAAAATATAVAEKPAEEAVAEDAPEASSADADSSDDSDDSKEASSD